MMLRPLTNAFRDCRALDGLWRFALDAEGVGRDQQWWRGALPGKAEMPVPASYNDIPADAAVRDHVGEVWYQTSAHVPATWGGQRIVLRFGAAAHRATVWVDDQEVVSHVGGYTPFEADVTDLVRLGEANRVTVVVDNRLDWDSIPPGYVEDTPDGPRQRYHHDFFNYAGLHRTVSLYATPPAHITDVTVTTDLDGLAGIVDYEVRASEGERALVALHDAAGTEVARAEGLSGRLRVEDVHPWRPGEGYLYELRVELLDAGGAVVDRYSLNVGVRTVAIDGTDFLINGEPFYFTGFGMHEDHVVRGKGHDDASMVHDFALLEWIGANSLRTSHYPYAEEVLDYADRHGIVVIDETAAVGLNLGIGGGIVSSSTQETYSDETVSARTQEAHRQAIRELVERDKNHPSVVLWSIANEPESHTDAARDYFKPLFAEARALDPSRPVGFVNVMFARAGECKVAEFSDVVMINRYYGWYVQAGDLAAAERALEAELHEWVRCEGKPIIMTEYGADAQAGVHSAVSQPWTEEYQVELLEMYHRVFDRVEAVVGEQVWNFADFATSAGFARVDGNKKGVFTRDRRPKAAAFSLKRRWHARGEAVE
ncbi:beta-glucuronidase [Saccharopolyspora terrae]|uniref:Beta-glucuronidase n=1 Tax=Saccharopolyspora terrae TaxID=2530384 RepID=A0A4R4W3G1_9PSEU|nr:beta-glucuronidase [Saccharopolyspora terrae]TDD10054.1 beta-glucuronidase [Saccharopolyspora terrae]